VFYREGLLAPHPTPKLEADACEGGNEPSGSMKCGEFLD